MPNWIALSPSQHGGKHYLPREGYSFAAEQQVIPILLAELSNLIPYYCSVEKFCSGKYVAKIMLK